MQMMITGNSKAPGRNMLRNAEHAIAVPKILFAG
jgi:hypothetical protein